MLCVLFLKVFYMIFCLFVIYFIAWTVIHLGIVHKFQHLACHITHNDSIYAADLVPIFYCSWRRDSVHKHKYIDSAVSLTVNICFFSYETEIYWDKKKHSDNFDQITNKHFHFLSALRDYYILAVNGLFL